MARVKEPHLEFGILAIRTSSFAAGDRRRGGPIHRESGDNLENLQQKDSPVLLASREEIRRIYQARGAIPRESDVPKS
jgi:hypothetical protein